MSRVEDQQGGGTVKVIVAGSATATDPETVESGAGLSLNVAKASLVIAKKKIPLSVTG